MRSFHHSSFLRRIALSLAASMTWTFALSSVAQTVGAQAAQKAHGKTPPTLAQALKRRAMQTAKMQTANRPFPSTRRTPPPPASAPADAMIAPPWKDPSAFRPLLDQVGHLARPVAPAQAAGWGRELARHPAALRAATLHLWLGEWQLAANEQPENADRHFAQARRWAHVAGPTLQAKALYGQAAFDSALALFYEGAYQGASAAFRGLLTSHAVSCDRRLCALWSRHAAACAGYHAQRAAQGIPEPPRLDPECGAAALAACLRGLALPYGRKPVRTACRVTGEGSTVADVLTAAKALGVTARPITADDRGLRNLPKPLVAYVEHDHFIAVTGADRGGVTYLCSDCGPWPGGAVHLSWQQWHALEATLFVAVTRPGSGADRMLEAALDNSAAPVRLSYAGRLSSLHLSRRSVLLSTSLLRGHVFKARTPGAVSCGSKPTAPACPPPVECCPVGGGPKGGSSHGGMATYTAGPSAGEPVNPATLEEEYTPSPDLTVYNPVGPTITWSREYRSLRGPGQNGYHADDLAYQSDDFGVGWSQSYNIGVYDPTLQADMAGAVQVPAGQDVSLLNTGTDAPASGLEWDIIQNDTTVATSDDPNGWDVNIDLDYGRLIVTVPTGAAAGTGYEARLSYPWINFTWSSYFDVASPYILVNGGHSTFITTGTDAPASGLTWDIVQGTTTIATSDDPHGWAVNGDWSNFNYVPVTAPSLATPGAGYEMRLHTWGTNNLSAPFTLVAPTCTPSAGTKYLVFPNGSRVSFSAPSVPSSGAPSVACSVQAGAPYLVEWDYDPGSPAGYYTITLADRTRWVTGEVNPASLCYALGRIVDPQGNAITFQYDTQAWAANTTRWLLLSSIKDGSGATLLSINRATDGTGNITSISDCYGRSVYYQTGAHATTNVPYDWAQSYQELEHVSQVVTTGAGSPPDRWEYGYQSVSNTEGSETTPFLHTITVPSPTGSGTAVATINYDSTTDLVSSIVDANGNTISFASVDATGNPSYPSNYTQVTYTDSSSAQVYSHIIGFDSNMSETSDTDGTGNVVMTKAFSDPNDPYRPSSVTDGNGKTTDYTWDSFGNLLTETPPSNLVRTPEATTYTYDYTNFALGELTDVQEGTKTATSYTYYEPSGLVQSVSTPTPGTTGGSSTVTTTYTYDLTTYSGGSVTHQGLGNLLTVAAPAANNTTSATITTTYGYTTDGTYTQTAALGQPITVTDNLGKVSHLRYDAQGRPTSVTDALGNETDLTYNVAGQLLQTTLPATGQTGTGQGTSLNAYLYAGGPLTSTSLYDESSSQVREVDYAYGPEGEAVSASGSTDPVTYTYDALYRTKSLSDSNSHTTRYYYDKQGYLDATTYPGYSGFTPAYNSTTGTWPNISGADSIRFPSYDANGNVLERIDGNGVEADYTHSSDPESLLTAVHYIYPTGYTGGTAGDVSFSYDGYGRREGMTDGTGSVSYSYDDNDDPLSVNTTYMGLATKSVSYTYYPDGSRESMTTPAGAFSYAYDADGRMTGLTNPYSEASSWQYLDNGWLWKQTLGNGAVTTYTYNALGQTTDLVNKTSGGTTLSDFTVASSGGYDGAGNRTAVTASLPAAPSAYSGASSYAYDTKDQLTQETSYRTGGYTNTFGYDGAGNATTFRGAARTFNVNNQHTSNTYDGNGNPTTYNGSALTFDPENRATAFGSALTAGYTGDGLRAWKDGGAGKTYFLYDGGKSVCEMNSSGSVTATDTFSADGLLSRCVSSTSTFYTFDSSGNVAQRLNSSGSIVSSDTYDAFGNRVSTGSGDVFGFGGQWGYYTDSETGLALCTHRYYDPGTGRWLTRDPIGYAGGINLYEYVGNDPVMGTDTQGLQDRVPVPPGWPPGGIPPLPPNSPTGTLPTPPLPGMPPGPGQPGYDPANPGSGAPGFPSPYRCFPVGTDGNPPKTNHDNPCPYEEGCHNIIVDPIVNGINSGNNFWNNIRVGWGNFWDNNFGAGSAFAHDWNNLFGFKPLFKQSSTQRNNR